MKKETTKKLSLDKIRVARLSKPDQQTVKGGDVKNTFPPKTWRCSQLC